jgi:hypothetical protein
MATDKLILDGSMAYGTVLMVCSNGQTYTLDDFTVNRGHTLAQDFKSDGSPNRERITPTNPTFTAKMQLGTSTQVRPNAGCTFSVNVDANFGSETFKIFPVDYSSDNGAGNIRTVPVTGSKVLNTITLVAQATQ